MIKKTVSKLSTALINNGIKQPKSPYYTTTQDLIKKSKAGHVRIARMIKIIRSEYGLETGKIICVLSYFHAGKIKEISVASGDINYRNILKLRNDGVDVRNDNAVDVVRHLNFEEEAAKVVNVHERLGFAQHDGKKIYKHHTCIGEIQSKYVGDVKIASKGSIERWCAIIEKETILNNNIWAQLALILGFSAPVVSYISSMTGIKVIFAHLYGDSSQGKTTALQLAVSAFGMPDKDGLLEVWNSTENAIAAKLRGINGVPIGFDEIGMSDMDSFTRVIYRIAGGSDKSRLDKEGNLRKTEAWSGTFLSNGEKSMENQSTKFTGAKVRLMELFEKRWTLSADNAKNIHRGIMDNYGQAGPIFVKYLMEQSIASVVNIWHKHQDALLERVGNSDIFSARVCDQYAIILTTAELVNAALQLNLDESGIMEILVSHEQETAGNRDIGMEAYDAFKSAVTKNYSNFYNEEDGNIPKVIWGKRCVDENGSTREVYVKIHEMPNILKPYGFDNVATILSQWKDKGLLDSEKNRNSKQKTIIPHSKIQERVYVVRIRDDYFYQPLTFKDSDRFDSNGRRKKKILPQGV